MNNTNTSLELTKRANTIITILNQIIGEGNKFSKRVKEIRDDYETIKSAVDTKSKATCTVEITKVTLHLFGSVNTHDIDISLEALNELANIYESKLIEACACAENVYHRLTKIDNI